MDEWQPIETAPRDGTYVLVTCAGPFVPAVVCWATDENGTSGWTDDPEFFAWPPLDLSGWPLTHWMPLPLPPDKSK